MDAAMIAEAFTGSVIANASAEQSGNPGSRLTEEHQCGRAARQRPVDDPSQGGVYGGVPLLVDVIVRGPGAAAGVVSHGVSFDQLVFFFLVVLYEY